MSIVLFTSREVIAAAVIICTYRYRATGTETPSGTVKVDISD